MARYAELHCHSNFSFLDGASHPGDLVRRAAELGYTALAITDHHGFYGAPRFRLAAEEVGLATVYGVEVGLGCEVPPAAGGGGADLPPPSVGPAAGGRSAAFGREGQDRACSARAGRRRRVPGAAAPTACMGPSRSTCRPPTTSCCSPPTRPGTPPSPAW